MIQDGQETKAQHYVPVQLPGHCIAHQFLLLKAQQLMFYQLDLQSVHAGLARSLSNYEPSETHAWDMEKLLNSLASGVISSVSTDALHSISESGCALLTAGEVVLFPVCMPL